MRSRVDLVLKSNCCKLLGRGDFYLKTRLDYIWASPYSNLIPCVSLRMLSLEENKI